MKRKTVILIAAIVLGWSTAGFSPKRTIIPITRLSAAEDKGKRFVGETV